jgi:uncharacterized membrane protein
MKNDICHAIFPLGTDMARTILGLGILAVVVVFIFVTPISSLFTFPWLIVRWVGILLSVFALVLIAKYEPEKKPEPEAPIPA